MPITIDMTRHRTAWTITDQRSPYSPASTQVSSAWRVGLMAGVAIYVALLHLAYVYLTAPYFGYEGMYYSPLSDKAVVLSWLFALLPTIWLPLRSTRPSLVVYYLLYAFVIIPACLVPAYVGALSLASLITMQAVLLTCFALLGLIYVVPLARVPHIRFPQMWLGALIALFSCTCYLAIMHFIGFSLRFPDPLDVYGVRADYNQLTAEINSKWLQYCVAWQSNVINPFMMAYGLTSKKYYIAGLGLVGQLVIYALGGVKVVLFSFLLLLALYAIGRYKCFGVAFISGITVFSGLCMVLDLFLLDTHLGLTSLFVRRLIFLPGQLTGMYVDFFSANPFALLGHSILKGFVTYPYSLPPPQLIGATYFGGANANANLWADGFANFGYSGMLGMTVLLGCWMWLIDSIGARRNSRLIMLMLGVLGIVLANSALLTAFANQGLGAALLLIYSLPREFGSFEPRSAFRAEQQHRPVLVGSST
jgi:hypothetical protein